MQSPGGAIMAVHGANTFVTNLMICGLLSACAAESNRTTRQDAEYFCTIESGYQQGVEGAEYLDVCPDLLAPAFLDGYQTGFAVHLAQLEIDAMERAIEAMSSDLKQTWSALDRTSIQLEGSDATPAEQQQWRTQVRRLATRQQRLTEELDELETEVAFRKTQLLHLRHTIAANE
jgi:Protein of unknown function (DUF2799)